MKVKVPTREPPGSNTGIVSSRIPALTRVRLRRLAIKRGITVNRLIKEIIQQELEREGDLD